MTEETTPQPERIRVVEPSLYPLVVAFGITLTLVGVFASWLVFVPGAIATLIPAVCWIKQTRREISELPVGS